MGKPPQVDETLSKEDQLNELMRMHRHYEQKRLSAKKKLQPIFRELQQLNSIIGRIGAQINKLKHGSQIPLVTDHAIVRYLERVEDMDIEEIRGKIARHSRAVISENNVIVTVNGDQDESPN